MSQSLLYHAFGIPKTYRYVRTEYAKGAVWFSVRLEREASRKSAHLLVPDDAVSATQPPRSAP
jgi:hypothetical protein